jgi:hypothetical protein
MYYVFVNENKNHVSVVEEPFVKKEQKEKALFTVEKLPTMPKAKEGYVLDLVLNETQDGIEYAYVPIFTTGTASLTN